MIRTNQLLAFALIAALAAQADAQNTGKKKLYCWNEDGRKVCGDALPAEAAGSSRTEFSSNSGRRTGEVAAALTPAERAAAAAAAAPLRRRGRARLPGGRLGRRAHRTAERRRHHGCGKRRLRKS
jgi:hypothetical protein